MLLKRVGFIGAGKIAQAFAKGLILSGNIKSSEILASCHPTDIQSAKMFESFGSKITHKNCEVVNESDVVILAVKPFICSKVLDEIRKNSEYSNKLFLSIMMGVKLKELESFVTKVIRIMSNTATEICQGTTVYVPGNNVENSDLVLTHNLLSSFGFCERISDENLIDISTALCGSGPAFVYVFIESLASGAVKLGMDKNLAMNLAINTVLGSSAMVANKKTHPAILKDDVTSPGGSTAMGLYELENNGFRSAVMKALKAATDRCYEVSKLNA